MRAGPIKLSHALAVILSPLSHWLTLLMEVEIIEIVSMK